MLVASRTGHRFGEHHEAAAAADVLGRAAPDAVDERGIVDPGISVADHLHDDSVPAAISDIVTAVEPVRAAIGDRFQADAPWLADPAFFTLVPGSGLAMDAAADHELEEVRGRAAGRCLDNIA